MINRDDITEYLKEKYEPSAIILHGSRANNMARDHSDWDFILLYESTENPGSFREKINDQNVEIQSAQLPVEDILDVFGNKLQYAKALYEKGDEGTELLKRAKELYQRGFVWPETWPNGVDLWMQGRIGGMEDNMKDPLLFYRYFSQFYPRAISDWFRVLHREYSKPEYLALPEISRRDPEYYKLLIRLVSSDASLSDKVETARNIHTRLFKGSYE